MLAFTNSRSVLLDSALPGRALRCAVGFAASLLMAAIIAAPASAQLPAALNDLVFHPAPLPQQAQAVARSSSTHLQNPSWLLALGETGGEQNGDSFTHQGVDSALNLMPQLSATDQYLRAIAQLEATESPFSPALFQNLTSLGTLYQQQQEHARAVDVLERAAAISRVNSGLFSAEQIALTQQLVDSLMALGRIEELADKHEYLVHLHQQYYGVDAPQTASALKDLGEWKLDSFHYNLQQPGYGRSIVMSDNSSLFLNDDAYNAPFESLFAAQQNFLDAIVVLIENEAFSSAELFQLEENLLKTFFIHANRELVLSDPRNYALLDAGSAGPVKNQSRELKLPEDYNKGVNAYRRMVGYIKKNPDATMQQLAHTLLGLADWHLMFGNYNKAEEQYQQLGSLMEKAGMSPAEISHTLQPAVPPTLPAFLETGISAPALPDVAAYQGYVDVTLQLNRYGQVRRVDLLGRSEGASENIEARLVSLLRNAQFRPPGNRPSATGIRYYYSW